MYIVRRAVFETLKVFLFGIICSVIFSLMIYRDSALPNPFICFILNFASLVLFLFMTFKSWSRLYLDSFTAAEYFIPTLISFAIYTLISGFLYHNRFFMYMWLFLPTRFLEPMLKTGYDYVSFITAQLTMFVLIFLTPGFTVGRK